MAVVASYTSDVTEGSIPLVVNFTDTSTGSPTHRFWDFGDGSVGSDRQNPSHTYTEIGTYTVTFTTWVRTGGTNIISSSAAGTQKKNNSTTWSLEVDAWLDYLSLSWVSQSNASTRFKYYSNTLGKSQYTNRKNIYRLDLTPYSDKIIVLYYRSRFLEQAINCNLQKDFILTSDIPEIPDQVLQTTFGDAVRSISLLHSPDNPLYGGTVLDMEIEAIAQRIGALCDDDPGIPGTDFGREWEIVGTNGVEGYVYTFSSQDSETKANFIIANDPLITRPPLLFSGNKEVNFSDGWENKKHFLVKQTDPYPCSIQAIDLYVETSDGD